VKNEQDHIPYMPNNCAFTQNPKCDTPLWVNPRKDNFGVEEQVEEVKEWGGRRHKKGEGDRATAKGQMRQKKSGLYNTA